MKEINTVTICWNEVTNNCPKFLERHSMTGGMKYTQQFETMIVNDFNCFTNNLSLNEVADAVGGFFTGLQKVN